MTLAPSAILTEAQEVASAAYDLKDMPYRPYGGAYEFLKFHGSEAIISGPAETGKTLAALWKLHLCACKHPGASIVIARKTQASMYSTVLVTYRQKVLDDGARVVPYGAKKPQWFDYPNGSRIWLMGLDRPGKVLSAEHDIIYVNQAEEIALEDWEIMTTRTTGRAGNMPYSQTIGDMNPSYPAHWIYRRESLKLFWSHHSENPLLFDQDTKEITEQGRRTMAVLENLTGVRRTRLLEGKAAQAEGAIYTEWDEAIHLLDRFPIPPSWRKFRVIDFGYTNPFVCQWWAVDDDGRMYLYRELYMSQRTVKVHSGTIHQQTGRELYETTVCDHDAEDRATLAENDIINAPADKRVSVGIEKVTERLKVVAADGRPRLFILRDSLIEKDPVLDYKHRPLCTVDEIPAYVWAPGKAIGVPEIPVKENDHGVDAMRYAVMYVDHAQMRMADMPQAEEVVSKWVLQ